MAKTGAVKLHGGRYWSEELLAALAGRPKSERSVVVRYDPDHLDRPVIVEDRQGRVIARDVEPWGKVPFLDTREARGVARDEGRLRKLAKEQLKTQKRMDDRELDRLLSETPVDAPVELPLAAADAGGKAGDHGARRRDGGSNPRG